MANIKISELTALTPPDAADLVPVTDVSASQTKRTTVGEVVGIINGDVDVADDGTATISELPVSKLQDGAARQLLQTAANGTDVEWTDDVDIPGTLDVTSTATLDAALNVAGLASLDGGIDVDGAFTVANTSGNIATSGTLGVTGQSTLASAAVSDLTSGRVVLAGTSGELEDSAGLTFNGTQLDVDGNVVITGDLTVEGASTILETETVKVEDKNIELGVVASPTDVTADGGGITLKGTTDKTINWVDATDSWTSSEHVDLTSGKSYRINGTEVLSSTTLGSGVTGSSLTSVGTIGTGVWQGTAIDAAYLDATIVTTGDTGTVTSAMLADGTIVDADVNASAAIAGTKISPDFGSQNVVTTGTSTAASFIPTSSTVPTNGVYLPSANNVAISTNNIQRISFGSDGDINIDSGGVFYDASTNRLAVGTTSPVALLNVATNDLSTAPSIDADELLLESSGNTGMTILCGTNQKGNIYFGEQAVGISRGAIVYDTNTDALAFSTNGLAGERARLDSFGRLLLGTSSDSGGALLQVNGDRVRIATAKTPASASDTGTTGEVSWDADYIYVCTATNTWKRAALSTW